MFVCIVDVCAPPMLCGCGGASSPHEQPMTFEEIRGSGCTSSCDFRGSHDYTGGNVNNKTDILFENMCLCNRVNRV